MMQPNGAPGHWAAPGINQRIIVPKLSPCSAEIPAIPKQRATAVLVTYDRLAANALHDVQLTARMVRCVKP